MGQFLIESELTESRAVIEFFAQKLVVSPDDGFHYTIPMPHDGWAPGKDAEEVALHSPYCLPSSLVGRVRGLI